MTPAEQAAPREDGARRIAQVPVRVLVVDDDRDTVLALRMLLDAEGYETRGAHDGTAALRLANEFRPHAMLIDIGMPGPSGYEVARQVRESYGKQILLVAVTAWTQTTDRMLAQLAGFSHHIGKPYRPQDILALLAPLTNARG